MKRPLAIFVPLLVALCLYPLLSHHNQQPEHYPGYDLAVVQEAGRQSAAARGARYAQRGGPKPTDMPGEAAEFFVEQRLPIGEELLPHDQLHSSLLEVRQRQASLEGLASRGITGSASSIQSWTELGPGNIGGRTRAIVINPNDPNIVYAAGVSGGIWKSTDAGNSWNVLDDLLLNLSVSTLALDPTNPDVIYAGTGEGFFGSRTAARGLGIFKSTDAGATWTLLPGTVSPAVPSESFHYVQKIRISPNNSNHLYAATRFGVWKSTDSGTSWTPILANPNYHTPVGVPVTNGCQLGCTDLALRTDSNPDVLWAAFGSFQSDGLYRSDDGGATWVPYTTASYQGRMTISISPADNNRVYLAMADNGGLASFGRIVSVYRSDDGVNFSSVLDFSHPFSEWLFSYYSVASGCITYPFIPEQGWYDQLIKADPIDPDVVWIGGINVYRSDDAGKTFGIAGYWFWNSLPVPPPDYMHADQHTITFHPDYNGTTNQTMYLGNDGGIWKTDNATDATSQEGCPIGSNPGPPPAIAWTNLNNGYGVTQFYHGDASATTDRFAAGAQDNGTSKVDAVGTPNNWESIFGGDGGYVAMDPRDPDRFFVEIQGFPTIEVTTDGGQTFTPAVNGITDTDGVFIVPYTMDQNNPDIMWTGGSRPWRTVDGSANWTLAGPDFPNAQFITAIAIAPSDPNIVYMGFNNGYVAKTTNGLDPNPTWTEYVNGLYGGWVSSLTVNPDDPDIAYLTYSTFNIPHIHKTIDGGLNWSSIDGVAQAGVPDIPAHWIVIRPCNTQELYVGTELGVFTSDDDGATWLPSNHGMPNVVVETLDFQNDNTLIAFTHGRGAFRATLDPCATTGTEDSPPAIASLVAAPNPFQSAVTIQATLPSPGRTQVDVFDIAGRRVAKIMDADQAAGPLRVTWDGRNEAGQRVAPGIYFVKLVGNDLSQVKKIVRSES